MRSHIGREYLLVLKILLQRDAAGHNSCKLDVVHGTGAGVARKVFFDDFLANPANSSDKAGDGCGVEERLHELVVRHGVVYIVFKFRLNLRFPRLSLSIQPQLAAAAVALVLVQRRLWS